MKTRYANNRLDPAHLVAVDRSLNRQKGSKGPDEWRPPNKTSWCWYATNWWKIKADWGLRMTQNERAAVEDMLEHCDVTLNVLTTNP